jgi:hypothetical protein
MKETEVHVGYGRNAIELRVPRRFVWNLTSRRSCAMSGQGSDVRPGQGWTKATRRAWP